MKLLLATRNEHKLLEFARLLEDVELEPLPDDVMLPPEVGETFTENAAIKAHAAAAATGRPAIADDSGIGAAALNGAPGVRSARYAGEDATDSKNLAKLISEVPIGDVLTYSCSLVYVDPATGEERIFEGHCSGTRAEVPRGERGFGYDPIFFPAALTDGRTMAELTDAEKDHISHRGDVSRQLLEWLRGEKP